MLALNVNQLLVDAIHSRNVGISDFSSIVSCIRRILASNYNFDVKVIQRQANMVAYSLSKAAIC